MPPQKPPKQQPKAAAAEKQKSADRTWMTTAELASKIGWREHSLRDALRQREMAGIHRTAFGYKIDAGAVEAIQAALGPAPAKPNSPLRPKTKPGDGGGRAPA